LDLEQKRIVRPVFPPFSRSSVSKSDFHLLTVVPSDTSRCSN
jgi:hypothetical protein